MVVTQVPSRTILIKSSYVLLFFVIMTESVKVFLLEVIRNMMGYFVHNVRKVSFSFDSSLFHSLNRISQTFTSQKTVFQILLDYS